MPPSPSELIVLPSPDDLAAERARRSLRAFVIAAWPVIEPSTPFVGGMHIDLICQYLEALGRGEIQRLLINVPPRYGKTWLVSVLFPAWLWLTDPGTRFLTASYGIDLAERDALGMRRVVESAWYQQQWPRGARLVADQATKSRFETVQGGARVAVSVGGAATGEGGDIILIDDPIKIDQADSAGHRQTVIDWYDQTMSSRLNDPSTGRIVVVGQRVHEDDLFGHLRVREGWRHLCLPAEYDPDHPYRTSDDPRTQPGELLWPERWDADMLARHKRELGSYRAASMLQQLPAPTTGGIFQRSWWQWYDPATPLPRFTSIVQSWDLAFTGADSADYVVGQVWGIDRADRYLLRQVRERLPFTDTLAAFHAQTAWVNQCYPYHGGHPVLIEQAANAAAVHDVIKHDIPGVLLVIPEGDKLSRAHAVCPQIQSGNVYLPGASNADHTNYDRTKTPVWVQAFVEETAIFPNAKNDDQVDALTQALRHAATIIPYNQNCISIPQGRLPEIRYDNYQSIIEQRTPARYHPRRPHR